MVPKYLFKSFVQFIRRNYGKRKKNSNEFLCLWKVTIYSSLENSFEFNIKFYLPRRLNKRAVLLFLFLFKVK